MGRKIIIISLLLFCLLALYTLLRVAFFNLYFNGRVPGAQVLNMFLMGVQLDFLGLFYINLAFLLYYFFIHDWLPASGRQTIALVLFLLLNIPFLAINFIDLGYFGFTARRSTTDLLFVTGDSLSSLPSLLKNYWYLFVLFVVAAITLGWLAKKILKKEMPAGKGWKPYVLALPVLLVMGLLARGFYGRPLMPSTPLLFFDAEYQPLINNSTVTFLMSAVKRQHKLPVKNYYSEKTLDSLFTIRRQYRHAQPFQRKNVVIFILESFCSDYFEEGNPYRVHAPFLDSIIAQSTWCNNAFANGTVSNQGIVSILGSIPAMIDEPYFYSMYSNNKIRGLGTILKEEGYSTNFFMGAGPDHFGFGKWCNMVGIDHYYSQKDFNDDRYYDGNWGIYDHKFLPYGAGILKKEKKPFLSVFFNLSSHHPFTLPPDMHDRFQVPGQNLVLNSVSYVDYSLRLFFDSIKNTDWYRNTVFVFSADHSVIRFVKESFDPYSFFRIPIFLYDPSNPVQRRIGKPVQQTDIVPTILDHLGYSKPFMAFGRSVYDSAYSPVIFHYLGITNAVDSAFILGYNESGEKPAYLYYTQNDTARQHNVLNRPGYEKEKEDLLRYNRAVIQRYNNSLIRNQLFIQ